MFLPAAESRVPRPGPRSDRQRGARRQQAAGRGDTEKAHHVGAEVRREDKSAGWVEQDLVRVGRQLTAGRRARSREGEMQFLQRLRRRARRVSRVESERRKRRSTTEFGRVVSGSGSVSVL